MSSDSIAFAAETGVFRPRQNFVHLAQDHVPLDELIGQPRYEKRALTTITTSETVVGVIGPRGAGKSSLIAAVCAELPDEYVALRVPITGADDPTSVNLMAAVALSQALNDIDMEGHQQQALEVSRADGRSAERASGGGGGTLGGGPIPIAIHAEVNTLRETHVTDALATDRLAGLDRLISILVARDRRPVFVLEDTEAAIGGASREETAEAFLAGPVHAFVHEIDAACLIAIQDVFTTVPSFKELATSMALVDIPTLEKDDAAKALGAIIENRLTQHGFEIPAADVIDADALEMLVSFYGEMRGNLRTTLAALQTAVEYAAEVGADRIASGHARGAVDDWLSRFQD